MWCTHCQQDVRGLPSAAGRYCCPRCSEPFGEKSIEPPSVVAEEPLAARDFSLAVAPLPPLSPLPPLLPPMLDDWEADEQLLHVERILTPFSRAQTEPVARRKPTPEPVAAKSAPVEPVAAASVAPAVPAEPRENTLVESSREPEPPRVEPQWRPEPVAEPACRRPTIVWKPQVREIGRRVEAWNTRWVLPALAWFTASVGLMSLACGSVLLAWSNVSGRSELAASGKPVAIGGIVLLITGLLVLADRATQQRRAIALQEALQPEEPAMAA